MSKYVYLQHPPHIPKFAVPGTGGRETFEVCSKRGEHDIYRNRLTVHYPHVLCGSYRLGWHGLRASNTHICPTLLLMILLCRLVWHGRCGMRAEHTEMRGLLRRTHTPPPRYQFMSLSPAQTSPAGKGWVKVSRLGSGMMHQRAVVS